MSLYEKNIQALANINPKLAARLFALQTNEKFEVFVDEKDPININIANGNTSMVLYEGIPIKQTQEKLDLFVDKYQRYLFLYFYGLGNGVFFKALLQNKSIIRVVVVEPEIEIIYIALNFNDFTKEIEERRLEIYLSQDINLTKAIEIFAHPESRLFAKVYQFHILLSFYEVNYTEDIMRINTLFVQAIEHAIVGIGNSSIDALTGIKQHIANINKMFETPTLLELINSCKNSEVAIIVSTGPSLKKQLPLLKKIQDYVTILCIDASFPILEKEDIKPDIVFSLERDIPTAKFYISTSKEFQKGVIFAITSIAHPNLFKEIKAGELQISMRPFGYTRYFDKPDYGYLGIGMSAANMAYELVFHANFKTCILIGQDLAFGEDGTSHSKGHIFGINDILQETHLEVLSYGGIGQVRTTKIWELFKNFFETDITFANEKGIKTINATEGGARIEGSIEMTFKNSVDKYVDLTHKKEKILLHKRTKTDINKYKTDAKKKIAKILKYAQKIKQETQEVFIHVAQECEIIDKIDEKERYKLVNFQKLADIMIEIDDIKKYFNQQIFADIFIDATQALIVHQEIDIAKIQVRNVKTDNEKRQKMIEWVYAHRYWLFSLAGLIQATIDAINMGIEMSLNFNKIEVIRVITEDIEIDLLHVNHKDILINNIYDLKQLCIDYKPNKNRASILKFYYSDKKDSFRSEVYMPTRDNERYCEFAFKNSLEATIDKQRMKNLYEKNIIGFLATEKNLQDVEFVEYIKELSIRFTQITFKVFCFNETEKSDVKDIFRNILNDINIIMPNSIYDASNTLDIFISTHNTHEEILLFNILRLYSNILTIHYNSSARFFTIFSGIEIHKSNHHPLLEDPAYFGYSNKDIIENDYSIHKLLYKDCINEIKDNDNLYEFVYFRVLQALMSNAACRAFYIKYARKEKKYLDEK